MQTDQDQRDKARVNLFPVDETNWRDVAKIEVETFQKNFVAQPLYYLALCNYGKIWHPIAICAESKIIGMLMWAKDDSDGSCWLGGITIDKQSQGFGYGRGAVLKAIDLLAEEHGFRQFALSYHPQNENVRELYRSLGFKPTGEMEDDEIVARLTIEE
jgi:diamine N-acetyltransferase